MKKMQLRLRSQGQVILVVLLAAAVLMTLGLSAAKRTVTDTKIDTDEELLKQAFNTAESGIDYYLTTGDVDYTSPDGKSKATVSINNIGEGTSLSSNEVILSGNSFLFWLVGHNNDSGDIDTSITYGGNTVNICVDNGFNKALKIDYFYKVGSNYQVARSGYNFGGSVTVNEYTANAGSCISNFIVNDGTRTPLLLAITPINGSTSLILNGSGGAIFPLQGQEITSVGQAGGVSSEVGVNSQVKVVNRYKIPAFMLDAITAGNSVLSN